MRPTFLTAFLLFNYVLCAQSVCEIWQWTGTDSLNKTLVKRETYNEQGKVVKEVYTNYIVQTYGLPEQVNLSTYRDTFLIAWTCSTPEGDSFRMVYEYNDAGQCIHRDEYMYKHSVPDTGQTGMFTYTDVAPDTTEGKWIVSTKGTYTYDRWGRQVMFKSVNSEGQEANTDTWSYDRKGHMLTSEKSFRGVVYRKDEYKQFKGGYTITMILYDSDGKPRHKLPKDSAEYRPLTIKTYKLDIKGRTTEVLTTNERKEQVSRYTMSYDDKGRILRDVFYDANDQPVVTHVYNYK